MVMIGCSPIVGMPLSLMAIRRGTSVTICHRQSTDVPSLTRQADIVVSATGHPFLVQESWVKNGAIVVDVGISRLDHTERRSVEHSVENSIDLRNMEVLVSESDTDPPSANTTPSRSKARSDVKENISRAELFGQKLHGVCGRKRHLVGDVDFEGVSNKASAITPVPGGVGPLTVAFLVSNLWKAAQYRRSL
jgi:methylenetetrahydrofolate dehydrogenase (NADP+)/methenyltetrahydrofolate cyclohydrolase